MRDAAIMSAAHIRRAVPRLAHEIVENNRGTQDLVFVGMLTRGVPLAHRIARAIAEFEGEEVPVGTLDVGLYRDDLTERGPTVNIQPSDVPDVAGKRVVLVDDVLYTARPGTAALAPPRPPHRLRPSGADPAGGARRPRPPRAADPGRLRRQEHPHRAQRRRPGPARRDRRRGGRDGGC